MSPPFERVAVVGLGLVGGSVALAACARGAARAVVGTSRSRDAEDAALARGAVHAVAELEAAVRGAELVVLATPVSAMAGVLRRAAPALARGALVTDVGSVKAPLAETLPGLLPPGVCYVGAHPMAGSHLRGLDHARADLFEGATCVVTPTEDSPPAAVARVAEFWSALGARVVRRSPAQHDVEVAWTSHLPHVLAFGYAAALAGAPGRAGEVAGSGFRDFTRIAHSDAELWSEILVANRKALAGPLHAFAAALGDLTRTLEAGDVDALERQLAAARTALGRAAGAASIDSDARSGGAIPEIQAARSGGHPRSDETHS